MQKCTELILPQRARQLTKIIHQHCANYARIWVFSELYFLVQDRVFDSVLKWENTGQGKPLI